MRAEGGMTYKYGEGSLVLLDLFGRECVGLAGGHVGALVSDGLSTGSQLAAIRTMVCSLVSDVL